MPTIFHASKIKYEATALLFHDYSIIRLLMRDHDAIVFIGSKFFIDSKRSLKSTA